MMVKMLLKKLERITILSISNHTLETDKSLLTLFLSSVVARCIWPNGE
jgi:hypothetical protein